MVESEEVVEHNYGHRLAELQAQIQRHFAANQATAWGNIFSSSGYLVPIVSIISHPALPRAEFVWMWAINILGSYVSAAVTALAVFCVIRGREQAGGGYPKRWRACTIQRRG